MRLVYRDNREWAEKCPGSVPFVKRSASRLSCGATSATKRLIRLAVAPDNTLPPPPSPRPSLSLSLSLSLSRRLSRHANCVQTNRRCADRRANTPALPRFPSLNLLLPSTPPFDPRDVPREGRSRVSIRAEDVYPRRDPRDGELCPAK